MTRSSSSAKDQLHHPRGKRGREDGRNGAVGKATGSGRPASTGRPATPRRPDDRRPPDVRDFDDRRKIAEVRRLPDVRTLASHRTSGSRRTSATCCLRTVIGPEAHVSLSHLPLRGPRLYILLHLLLVRVSIDLAQLEIELRSSTRSPPRERPRPPRRRSYRIQDPSWEDSLMDSRPPLGDELPPHVSSVVDFVSRATRASMI